MELIVNEIEIMKKSLYIYILCACLSALTGCVKDADVEPYRPIVEKDGRIVLTGYADAATRTGFGQSAEDGPAVAVERRRLYLGERQP